MLNNFDTKTMAFYINLKDLGAAQATQLMHVLLRFQSDGQWS